jgi:hypothetical protein
MLMIVEQKHVVLELGMVILVLLVIIAREDVRVLVWVLGHQLLLIVLILQARVIVQIQIFA